MLTQNVDQGVGSLAVHQLGELGSCLLGVLPSDRYKDPPGHPSLTRRPLPRWQGRRATSAMCSKSSLQTAVEAGRVLHRAERCRCPVSSLYASKRPCRAIMQAPCATSCHALTLRAMNAVPCTGACAVWFGFVLRTCLGERQRFRDCWGPWAEFLKQDSPFRVAPPLAAAHMAQAQPLQYPVMLFA